MRRTLRIYGLWTQQMTDTNLVTYLVLHDYLLLVKRTWLFASIGTYGDDYIPPIYKYILRRRHHSATWYYYGDATIPPLLDVHYGDDKIFYGFSVLL